MTLWILFFVCMMIMPLFIAVAYFKIKKGQILEIKQDYVKDARYFGRSFSSMVEKALPEMKDGFLMLSKPEKVLEIGENQYFANSEIENLVIVRGCPFCPKGSRLNFHKEIYCEEDGMFLADQIKMRAVYSKKRLLIGNGCKVLRWADAKEAVAVYDDCELGRRISSGEQLVIGFHNSFHSLFAPVIRLGQRPDDVDFFMESRDRRIFRLAVSSHCVYNQSYIYDDMIQEDGTVPYTILSDKNVKVTENIILRGDIRSECGVRLMENAVVLGNIFAENDILLEKNTTVLGNIFTQGNIIFEEGAGAGQPDKICSVVARGKVIFYGKNNVFGYVSAEGGGEVKEAEEKQMPEYCFPEKMIYEEELTFENQEEYESVDQQGFRFASHLKKVTIPDGAVRIPNSQFFGCQNIEEVQLPKSITCIGDFAFTDCEAMKLKESLSDRPLEVIGISAFENCKALTFSKLPDTLQRIGGAAFAGCESLEKLIFSEKAVLRRISDHAFRGCKQLREVYLPDKVEYIGISAFLGCDSIMEISVSEKMRNQPGIQELKKNCPKAQIQFRPFKGENSRDRRKEIQMAGKTGEVDKIGKV